MRTSAAVTCPTCDASWHADDARFCGACGARMGSAPSPEPAVSRPWLRIGFVLVAVIAVVGGALSVGSVSSFRLPPREADPAVEFDQDELTLEGEPLSDAERVEALAPFDPSRLRCEPEGCERWRVELPVDAPSRVQAAVVDDVVVTAVGEAEVRGYDLDSGEERWRAAWPDPADAPPPTVDQVLVSPMRDGVVVVWPQTGHLHALDPDGRTRWHAVERMGGFGFAYPIDDVVVVSGSSGEEFEVDASEGSISTYTIMLEDLRVLDAATGTALWEVGSVHVRALSDDALVVGDGATTRLLDVHTGEERARGELPMTGWLRSAGDVLLHEDAHEPGTWQLLSRDSFEVLAEIGTVDALTPMQDGSAMVGRVRGNRDTGDRILLFEPDGTLRWEQELSFPAGSLAACCVTPQVEDGNLVLPPVAGTTSPLRLDLDDGSALPAPPTQPGSVPAPGDGAMIQWVSPRTALSLSQDADEPTLIWHQGYRMSLRGQASRPMNRTVPLVFAGPNSIVAIQPVPRD